MVSVDIDSARVVMFENKIGGDIGYEPAPESNQLARQLDYLIGLLGRGVRDASLLLVSARALFDLGWYRQELPVFCTTTVALPRCQITSSHGRICSM
jgi:hypothetical protein